MEFCEDGDGNEVLLRLGGWMGGKGKTHWLMEPAMMAQSGAGGLQREPEGPVDAGLLEVSEVLRCRFKYYKGFHTSVVCKGGRSCRGAEAQLV